MVRFAIVLLAGVATLTGCTTSEVLVAHAVDLVPAQETVPEDQLLDVGITVFDPGVPEGEVDKEVLEELLDKGTFVEIRRAESMYMAVQLRDTMQDSGHWGGVWVTPEPSTASDLTVKAEILHSDGDIARVEVDAVDATGRTWISKPYEIETAAGAYNRQRYPDQDPYQDLFNMIANDLAAAQADLSAEDRREIRTVAELRYASEMSPEAFSDYVAESRNGIYEPVRLPAVGDPMFERTQKVRQRERLFFETLDQHYEKFSLDAMPSYDSWRQYAREESIAIKEAQRSARWRTGMGVATIVASILYGSNSDGSFTDRVIRDSMMYIGADMLRTSAVIRQEKRLHSETLEELSTSFDDEVAPLVVDVAGTQHRLVGTADLQYAEWRDLLKQLFISETGFVPEDMEIYAEPEAEPEAAPQAESAPTDDPAAPAEGQQVISDAGGGTANGA
jgi:hypothetical protein